MNAIKVVAVLCLYGFLFGAFGSFVTFRGKQERVSVGLTLLTGFFLYYTVFQIVTIPMMFLRQPLHRLTALWGVLVLLIVMAAIKKYGASWRTLLKERLSGNSRTWTEWFWGLSAVGVVLANVLVVSVIYSSYWDATFYVGNVSYSVYYDTINTIHPLLGEPLEFFDIKHCLATYHMNDAVFCQLFGLHPMIETKTVMVIVVTLLLNLLYCQFAVLFFGENRRARSLFLAFTLLVNLCTYSPYTASSFILLRTYEGKAIAGALAAMMLFYWFICLFREEKAFYWQGLFITAWGAVTISTSALFLVLAGTGIFALVQWGRTRRFRSFLYSGACMLPALAMLLCYLLNRLGIFYVYTS